ncbi:MAG: ABC transporter ATP-binding protein [Verrucomicrobiae bacterium]|nr:ABC transporter ATP-binding protein [Verrucomicrobiae bacterium]
MLSVENVSVHYGAIHALKGVSLQVHAGEIVALIGANGTGKSSLLRAISGLTPPSEGAIVFQGTHAIHRLPPHEIVGLGIAHVPEGRAIFANFTVEENLMAGAYLRHDRLEIAEDLEWIFGIFPRLKERRRQSAATLSGGEQQMLAISRALMGRPRLLLLDEPSLGLAPIIVQSIFKTIRQINAQGATILLVEQNAHMALHAAARGYVIQTGQIVMEGPSAELLASKRVRQFYLGET